MKENHEIQSFISSRFTRVLEVSNWPDANSLIDNGFTLLGVHTCDPEDDKAFIYCLGWDKDYEQIPVAVRRNYFQ